MPPSTSRRVLLIRSWSRRFGYGLTFVLVALPLGMIAALLSSWLFGIEVQVGWDEPVNLSALPLHAAALLALGVVLDFGLHLVPLAYLLQLFNLWARGDILTREAARAIRWVGIALFVASLVSSVLSPAVEMAINAMSRLPGTSFSFALELVSLLSAGVIYVVGLVLDEAALVAEDAELTI